LGFYQSINIMRVVQQQGANNNHSPKQEEECHCRNK